MKKEPVTNRISLPNYGPCEITYIYYPYFYGSYSEPSEPADIEIIRIFQAYTQKDIEIPDFDTEEGEAFFEMVLKAVEEYNEKLNAEDDKEMQLLHGQFIDDMDYSDLDFPILNDDGGGSFYDDYNYNYVRNRNTIARSGL